MARHLLLLIAALITLSASDLHARTSERATWVWESEALLQSGETEALISTSRKLGLSRIFLQLPRDSNAIDSLAPAISKLHDAGLMVEALDGDPRYALSQEHAKVLSIIESVCDYNDAHNSSERFDGMHLDVEPYLLEGFEGSERQTIQKSYLELLRKASSRLAQSNLPLAADIPFWFDTLPSITGQTSFLVDVVAQVKSVAVMAYRTEASGPNGVLVHVQDELKTANIGGKQILVALESAEGKVSLSFSSLGMQKLMAMTTQIESELQSNQAFSGVALHSYESMRSLRL